MKLWMVLLFPLVMLWPPAWLAIPVLIGVLIGKKLGQHRKRKQAEREHMRLMAEYYQRRAAREWLERGINPGWQV